MQPGAAESGATLQTAGYEAVVFDLDAVLAGARRLQATAWKDAFDGLFQAIGSRSQPPFSVETEYASACEGRLRLDAAAAVLASREIRLPSGTADDPPGHESVHGLATLMDSILLTLLDEQGIDRRDWALELVTRLGLGGLRTAVVSPSRNCVPLLAAAGALELFDDKIDGWDAEREMLSSKPAPDFLIAISRVLDVSPRRCMAIEDTSAGIRAARRADYGQVVALNRDGPELAESLSGYGADSVIDEQCLVGLDDAVGSALSAADLAALGERLADATPVMFLDYEEALEPIVAGTAGDPRTGQLRGLLEGLSRRHPTAVISACGLDELRAVLDVPGIAHAASDGLDVAMPDGRRDNRLEDATRTAWDRGEAVLHLVDLFDLAENGRAGQDVVPIFVGGGIDDEDAFATIDQWGIGISVGAAPRSTIAHWHLPDATAVLELLTWLSRR